MEVITEDKLRYLAGKYSFNILYLEKDYFLTILLYMIKDVDGIYFKGGTCLNKVFLTHKRLSEDLDFAAIGEIQKLKKQIQTAIDKDIFPKLEIDKTTKDFIRYHIFFNSYFQEQSYIILDMNKKASIHLKPEIHKLDNFYNLDFKIKTLNIEEIVAEKIRALIVRNQPRDYFDAYWILKKYKLNKALLKIKLKEANEEYDINRVFKNANRIYSKWESDLSPLINKKISFLTVINFLKKSLE